MSPQHFTCSRCGSTRLIPGTVGGAGRVLFKPSKIKKLITLRGRVDVTATACLDCGNVDMTVDPRAVVDLTGEPDAGGDTGS